MKTIWKYELTPGIQSINIPQGGSILTAQTQNGRVCVWALVDPSQKSVIKEFEVVATGQPFESESKRYINTVQISWTVWHVFEVI